MIARLLSNAEEIGGNQKLVDFLSQFFQFGQLFYKTTIRLKTIVTIMAVIIIIIIKMNSNSNNNSRNNNKEKKK